MLFSAEVTNSGVKTCFWMAAWRPARISSSDNPPWAKNFSIKASSDSAMYSMSCPCSCLTLSAKSPVAGRFGEFAALVAGVGDDFVARHVEHLVEAGAGVDGDGQREDAVAEMLADLGQGLVEIGLLLVEGIDDDHLGDAVLGGVFPHGVGADADAVVGVDDDEGEIADAQGAEAFADEIRVTGAVEDIELLAEPFEVHEGGRDGNLAVAARCRGNPKRWSRRRWCPCG